MKWLQTLTCSIVVLSLAACDGGETEHRRHDVYDGPALLGFHIYDSLGVDSEEDHVSPLTVDYVENDGWFELFWYVDSYRDYTVLVGINDRPSMAGATIIGSDLCGVGLNCDSLGIFLCRYTPRLDLGCGVVEEEAELNLRSVDYLLFDFPQRAYINVEVCDVTGAGCEESSLPVWLYY